MFKAIRNWFVNRWLKRDWRIYQKKQDAELAMLEQLAQLALEKIDELTPSLTDGKHTLPQCRKITKDINQHKAVYERIQQDIKNRKLHVERQAAQLDYALNH